MKNLTKMNNKNKEVLAEWVSKVNVYFLSQTVAAYRDVVKVESKLVKGTNDINDEIIKRIEKLEAHKKG